MHCMVHAGINFFNGPRQSLANHSVAGLYPGVTFIGRPFAHEKAWWMVVATHRLTWPDSEKYWSKMGKNFRDKTKNN